MILIEESCMSNIFCRNDSSDEFSFFPVDAPSTTCLDIVQTDSEDLDSLQFPEFTTGNLQRLSYHHHHYHHHRQQSDSPTSTVDYGSRSPSGSSDSGKQYKPQYTAELEVLCRICGDRASGFHYGVHSCEGCKGFFRRTLKKQLVYKPCQSVTRCKIDTGSRNKCQYCRYQRCLFAGMSQDAVRFGRMPKVEREKLLADREELLSTSSRRIVELRSLTDLIKAAFRDTFSDTIFFRNQQQKQLLEHQYTHHHHLVSNHFQLAGVSGSMLPYDASSPSSVRPCTPSPPTGASLENTVMGTAEILDTLTSHQFLSKGIFRRFQELTVPVMEASVRFAKKIPGFTSLAMRDQILLMKRNGFMVVHLALHSMITQHYILLNSPDGNLRVRRNSYHICEQMAWLLGHALIVIDKLHTFGLTMGEMALFSAVLLTQDCTGLSSPKQVEDLQANLVAALRLELKHNHPKEKVLLAKLLMLVPDLCQIVEQFSDNLRAHVFDITPDFSQVMPLLKEIFDLELSTSSQNLQASPESPTLSSASSLSTQS
ncbi:unnamed protein product [Candidula unifasciata]|uniref:Uncharacterized protein n=1 Tax=Candidula unifasciata TaxID=100452 RepID=A0A8S4A4R1_9EUPU|nr:unnamed protein product [Candidula unifasciata]